MSYVPRPPAPPRLLERAERALGHRLPSSIRALYEECNGLSLHWVHESSDADGRIALVPLEDMFGGAWGKKKWNDRAFRGDLWLDDFEDDLDPRTVATFKKLRVFERHEDEPPTCLTFTRGKAPTLHLVHRWNLQRLPLTVPQYLELLVRELGLTGWKTEYTSWFDQTKYRRDRRAVFAEGAKAKPRAEVGGRVFIDRETRLMERARGTVREVKDRWALVDLDIGLDGWVELRVLEPQPRDAVEELRDDPARLETAYSDPEALSSLIATMAPQRWTRSGVPLEAIEYDGPRPPSLSVEMNSPHLFGVLRRLPAPEPATRLIAVLERLLEDTDPTRDQRPNQHATTIALSALVLALLHEREGAATMKALDGHWPAALCHRLELLCDRLQALSWTADSDGRRPIVKFLRGCIRRVPGRAVEYFHGEASEKRRAETLGLSMHPAIQ